MLWGKSTEFSAGSGALPKPGTFHEVALLSRFSGGRRTGSSQVAIFYLQGTSLTHSILYLATYPLDSFSQN